MSESIRLTTPLQTTELEKLHIGDRVFISGPIYSCRDAAHLRLVRLLDENKPLPFDIAGHIIYYMGPSPAAPENP